jgi:hypothetical protein
MSTPIPTAQDVVAFLNERLAARGVAIRIDHVDVLPYVNPMWLCNWNAPELVALGEFDEELHEARWRFPQVLE